ncbi:latent-transforming growth factor beta-binding protein 2-like [Corticium candelabrum]|uniref:latent-transforming growth factor beta-binding protein 2-like n=1 Tax=Corticium candelabrum TaxID=121492 RepID=UPI002E300EBF|nr:latent-transforming growth factor beta-binding protein 2-like [Corticium candelabrum]
MLSARLVVAFCVALAVEIATATIHRGQCPVSSGGGFGSCVERCSSDANCTTDEKCCSNGCGHSCQKSQQIVHDGHCPPTSGGFGICVSNCTDDQDCQDAEKCCSNSCGHECKAALPLVHDGICPQHTGFGVCTNLCSNDTVCAAHQKCCSNGCGHDCMTALAATTQPPPLATVPITTAPIVHRGQCPVSSGGGFGSCVELCSSDANCTTDEKCCSNGCGHSCQKSQQIVHDGHCPLTSGGFGICISNCIDDQDCQDAEKCCSNSCGHECKAALPLVHDGICPQHTGFGVCTNLCSNDTVCAAHQKCCSNGCGHDCMTALAATTQPPPLATVPITTAPIVHRGQCPVSSGGGFGSCVELCSSDANCTTDEKCCSNGCGRSCQKSQQIVHDGHCPLTSGGFGICVSTCIDDQDCQDAEKCCSNSCGHECKAALPLVHDGICPQHTGFGVCTNLCSNDTVCAVHQKCCSNGCGHDCMTALAATTQPPPLATVPITTAPVVHRGQCPVSSGGGFGSCVELCSSDANCTTDEKCCGNGCGHSCQKSQQIVHDGHCPLTSGVFGICVSNCIDDQDCQDAEKCCSNSCGHECKAALPLVHDGICPQHTGFGICINVCSNDTVCAAHQKCCSNGCGHSCMTALTATTQPPPVVHRGQCPVSSGGGGFGFCVELCSSDASCTTDEKCCSNGCGHSCQKSQQIFHDGHCPPTSGGFGICVSNCADDQDCQDAEKCCSNSCGHECKAALPLVHDGICPQYAGFGICIDTCLNDTVCAAHQKCCGNGCGHSCMTALTATTAPVESPSEGSCPGVEGEVSSCEEQCFADRDCEEGEKCCSNGCGHICVKAKPDDLTGTGRGAATQASISFLILLFTAVTCLVY